MRTMLAYPLTPLLAIIALSYFGGIVFLFAGYRKERLLLDHCERLQKLDDELHTFMDWGFVFLVPVPLLTFGFLFCTFPRFNL